MALDALGIHHADVMSLVLEEEGQLYPVIAAGLHAGVHGFSLALLKPTPKLTKAAPVVGEVTPPGLLAAKQSDVEGLFGDVDTEGKLRHEIISPVC